MATPMPLADFVQVQMYQWVKTWQQEAMRQRAEFMNALEVIKDLKNGSLDPTRVVVADDGFEVMPPPPSKDKASD